VDALTVRFESDLGIDVADRAKNLDSRLDTLNQELADQVRALPPTNRRLVTGHESLGYFAQRYDFRLVGAIIPNLSSQAQVSASELAALKKQIQENQVKAIFVELGTPPAVASAISKDTGVKVIPLTTHNLPSDGSYFTFMRNLTRVVIDGLK
jgi:zinc/manganese transport system substrate-binding protein